MSGIKDTSTVTLNVNGAQAKRMLADIEKQLTSARQKLEELQAKGADAKSVEKQRKAVKSLESQLNNALSSVEGVNKALSNLDKATPRQLEKAVKTLKRELKDMPQGSETWQSHVEKLQQLEGRLKLVRTQIQGQKSGWEKFTGWVNNSAASIGSLVFGVTGAVASIKEYVDAFASMDSEMANVRKFTGMTAEQVETLNDQFKNLDTRTSREDLNKLAQEAGRLGKQSVEDVLGFVKAADKINVALDDLGEGATLTLSKLTGIFGIEEQFGTEKSLLKVGSIINELSQNCSASAPFIAEFSSRLGGVAAQAKMSISQVMAFAAVLDTQQLGVEASSSAMSQLITKIYKEPQKFAQAAKIDVTEFTNLVKTDMNGALVMLFENLQKYGGMSNLSKVFADMGTDGIRLQSVMAALTGHVEELKNQEIEASKAFKEGTSIDQEFAVQNNTVQAGLDKAKKSLNEVTVALGERLSPVMSYVINSGAALGRMVLTIIDYLSENRKTVMMAAISVAAWTVALNANIVAQKLWAVTMKTCNALALTLRTGSLGISAIFNLLTGNVTKATAAVKLLNTTLKGSLLGLAASLVAVLAGKLMDYHDKAEEAAKAQARLNKEEAEFEKNLKSIDKQSSEYSKKELSRLDQLYKKATDEAKSKDDRLAAAKRLQEMYPDYFQKLSTEAIMVGNAKQQYDDLTTSIIKAANARAAQDKIADLGGQRLDESQRNKGLQNRKKELEAQRAHVLAEIEKAQTQMNAEASIDGEQTNAWKKLSNRVTKLQAMLKTIDSNIKGNAEGINRSNKRMSKIDNAQTELADEYGVDIDNANTNPETPTNPNINLSDYQSQKEADKEARKSAAAARKAAAEAKREQAKAKAEFVSEMDEAKARYKEGEAENVVAYSQGLKTYQEYTAEKKRLDLKYVNDRIKIYDDLYNDESPENQKLLKDYDDEYQQFLLSKAEMEKQADDDRRAKNVSDLKQEYDNLVRQQNSRASDPNNTFYQNSTANEEALFQLKQEYLQKFAECYEEGTKERLEYEKQITQNDQEHMLTLKKRYAQKYEEWFAKYDTKSLDTREASELEVLKQLLATGIIKQEQFEQQKLALAKKYSKLRAEAESEASAQNYLYETADGNTIDTRIGDEKVAAKNEQREQAKRNQLNDLGKRVSAGLITDEEAEHARKNIEYAYNKEMFDSVSSSLDDTTKLFADLGNTISNIGNMNWDNLTDSLANIGTIAQSAFAVMSAGLETFTEFSSAQTEIDIANTEKAYDRKIEMAQGNSYKERKLEKEKEEKIAKLKNEQTKKEYSVKIANAIASTAQNAISAYGAGWQMGTAGVVLAPLWAGIATATGLVQVALIKKQQQAAEAQNGYADGGFTKPGGKYEPAGVVHAGEWVASQELLASPVARPLIEALDYAQRTNTIGSLDASDVSRSITAPDAMVRLAEQDSSSALAAAALVQNSTAVASLVDRLNSPFVTVNTVTGDKGIKQAQDDYDQLVRNKTPKSRRK